MIDDENDNTENDNPNPNNTTGGWEDSDDDPSILEFMIPMLKTAVSIAPVSAKARGAASTLLDECVRVWQDRRVEERAREKSERAEELAAELREKKETARRQKQLYKRREAEVKAEHKAAVREVERQEQFVDALERCVRAETTLEALVPKHWAAKLLREAALQEERHIQTTIEIAESLGASRADLEKAVRLHIAEIAIRSSLLTVDLLRAPLTGGREELDPSVTTHRKNTSYEPVA